MKGAKAILGLVILILSFVLMGSPASAKDIDLYPENSIDAYIDCGIWAYNPVRLGGVIRGKVEVSCLTSHARITVYVTLDSDGVPGPVHNGPVNCYGTDYCSAYVDIGYVGGYYWITHGSGYVGSWNAYYQSDRVYIP